VTKVYALRGPDGYLVLSPASPAGPIFGPIQAAKLYTWPAPAKAIVSRWPLLGVEVVGFFLVEAPDAS
jgi:hypothetical protein